MLAKNREQRYQTARELLADLETLQGELAAMPGFNGSDATRTEAMRELTTRRWPGRRPSGSDH